MCENYNPFILPIISFIGGGTEQLVFHTYFVKNNMPFDLSGYTCNFAVTDFQVQTGTPVINKSMNISFDENGTQSNVLTVTLEPSDTIDMYGKYIYQIAIKDINGNIEPPAQGILYVDSNINKSFSNL